MRKCKCKICGQQLTTDNAYKVTNKGKNSYYCTEEEYNQQQEEIEQRKKCMSIIQELTHSYAPCYLKEFKEVRNYYNWRVIIESLKECNKSITWFLSNNQDSSDFAKARYIKTCVLNVANKCKMRVEKEDRLKAKLFETKVESIDIDIMNVAESVQAKREVNDISEFL